MKSFHGEALVLKKKPLKEKDELLVFLTKYQGKQAFYSYGSRDPKSRKSGILELFNTVSFEARESKGQLPVLQQVKLMTSRGLGMVEEDDSLETFYRASEMLKMTDEYLHEAQQARQVFDDLSTALDMIKIPFIFELYKIRLLTDLGFLPDWKSCVICHEGLDLQELCLFDSDNNGFAHLKCLSLGKRVSSELLKVMAYFQQSSLQESTRVDLSGDLMQDLRECLEMIRVEEDI